MHHQHASTQTPSSTPLCRALALPNNNNNNNTSSLPQMAAVFPLQPSIVHSFGLELGLQSNAVLCSDDGGVVFSAGTRVLYVPSDSIASASEAASSTSSALPAQRLVPSHPHATALVGFDASFDASVLAVVELIAPKDQRAQGAQPRVHADESLQSVQEPDRPASLAEILPRGEAVASVYTIPHSGGHWQFRLVSRFVSFSNLMISSSVCSNTHMMPVYEYN
jgi:hypothetical protein